PPRKPLTIRPPPTIVIGLQLPRRSLQPLPPAPIPLAHHRSPLSPSTTAATRPPTSVPPAMTCTTDKRHTKAIYPPVTICVCISICRGGGRWVVGVGAPPRGGVWCPFSPGSAGGVVVWACLGFGCSGEVASCVVA